MNQRWIAGWNDASGIREFYDYRVLVVRNLSDNERRAMASHAPVRRDDILVALRDGRSMLDVFGVARLSLFGSFARDEGREDSDVDLLVEFNRPVGLFEFVRLQRQLAELVGHRVDLVTPAALKPQLRNRILREAVVAA